jgi:hypothetical protein
MASTIPLVRAAIVNAIKGIATTAEGAGGLGFDSNTAIHDYLFDYQKVELWSEYLLNDISSTPELRAVGVMVTSDYPQGFFFDFGGNTRRTYTTTIEIYSDIESSGAGVNRVILLGENILKAIHDIDSNLGGVVDFTDSPSSEDPNIVAAPDDWEHTDMLLHRITIESQTGAATW